jgi:hypothetical protein
MDEGSTGEMMFTAEELEALEPIIEEVESPVPSIIGGISVDKNPRPKEIKDVVDVRRIGPHRKTYYLARSIDEIYYWFHSSRADRDPQLRKLAGDYRRKVRLETRKKKMDSIKKLRSGRKVRM